MSTNDIGGLTILGTTTLFEHLSTRDSTTDEYEVNYPTTQNYPTGPYTILGPVLLPQIYGKDLNAIEVGSSGIISLSIYDSNVLTINSNLNTTNDGQPFNMITVEAANEDEAINLRSGTQLNKIVLDSLMVSENETQNIISTSKTDGLQLNDVVAITQTLSVEDSVFFSSNLSVAGVVTLCNNTFVEGKIFKIPVGSNIDRPVWDANADIANELKSNAPTGSIFFNAEEKKFQGLHDDGVWRGLGGVIDTDSDTFIIAETEPGSDEDTLYFHAHDKDTARMVMNESNLSVNLDVQLAKTLSVGDTVYFESSLSVKGHVDMHGKVQIADNLSVAKTLKVDQSVYFGSTLSVHDNTDIQADLQVGNQLSVEGLTTLGDQLSVEGFTTLASTLFVGDEATFYDTVFLQSNLSVEAHTDFKGFVQMGSTLSVNDDVTFASKLSVTDAVTFSDVLSVASEVTFQNTLSVGETVFLNSNLSVKGETFLENTLSVHGATTIKSTLSVGNDVSIQPTNQLIVDKIRPNGDEIDFFLGTDNTGTLRVHGDLEILGTLNQLETTVETVKVNDKTITLAVGDDDIPGSNQIVHIDSKDNNHKAGIRVEGRPVNVTQDDDLFTGNFASMSNLYVDNIYEKSILWNIGEQSYNQYLENTSMGMKYMGGLNTFESIPITNLQQIERESFWEIKGGSLRITSLFKNSSDLIDKVSYGFRISRNKQLQIVKHEWNSYYEDDGVNVNVANKVNILQTLGVSFN